MRPAVLPLLAPLVAVLGAAAVLAHSVQADRLQPHLSTTREVETSWKAGDAAPFLWHSVPELARELRRADHGLPDFAAVAASAFSGASIPTSMTAGKDRVRAAEAPCQLSFSSLVSSPVDATKHIRVTSTGRREEVDVSARVSAVRGRFSCGAEVGRVSMVLDTGVTGSAPSLVWGFLSPDGAEESAVVIEPARFSVAAAARKSRRSLLGDHIIYRAHQGQSVQDWIGVQEGHSLDKIQKARDTGSACGVTELPKKTATESAPSDRTRRAPDACEAALMGDFKFFTSRGSDYSAAVANLHALMVATSDIYRAQSVGGFIVTSITIYESSAADPYTSSSSGYASFLSAVNSNMDNYPPIQKCLVHGFTHTSYGSTVGYAGVGSVCRPASGITTTLSQFGAGSFFSNTNTLAHEIAHNYGAGHDSNGNFLMSPVGGSGTIQQFSPGSLNAFASTPRNCLVEPVPGNTVAACGNGVQELSNQEQCDCGNKCASDTTCTSGCLLENGAQCSPLNGECCTAQGTLLPAGTECGQYGDGYDFLKSYCDGFSAACPESNIAADRCSRYSNVVPCDQRSAAEPCLAGCRYDTQSTCRDPSSIDNTAVDVLPDGTPCTAAPGNTLFGVCQSGTCCDQPPATCPAGAACGEVTNGCGRKTQCGSPCGPGVFCNNFQCSGTAPPAGPPPVVPPPPPSGAGENAEEDDESTAEEGSAAGAAIGITLAVLVVCALIAGGAFFLYKKRKNDSIVFQPAQAEANASYAGVDAPAPEPVAQPVRPPKPTPPAPSGSSPAPPTRGLPPTPKRGLPPTPNRGLPQTPNRGLPPTPKRGLPPTPKRGLPPRPQRY